MTSFTQPDGAAATGPGAPLNLPDGPGPSSVLWIALDRIAESPFNPRRDMAKESLAELAESIRARGLLEPLVVRETAKAGRYELLAGHRRLRALRPNKAEGCQCSLVQADDGEARATLIVENLQREDLGPMEEAEAFRALQDSDPKRWTGAAIAAAIGKTARFVQQRLSLVNLAEPMRKRFEAGELNVESARILSQFPAVTQAAAPQWSLSDPQRLRDQLFEMAVPESAAKFDVALYTGGWIEHPKKKRRYFLDTAQFRALQRPAAEKKLEEVRASWPEAKLIEPDEAAKLFWGDQDYTYGGSSIVNSGREGNKPARFVVPREKCRAVVWIATNGEIHAALGACTQGDINAANQQRQKARANPKPPESEPAAHKAARHAFNAALAKAYADPPNDFVPRLQLMQRLTSQAEVETDALPKELKLFKHLRWEQRDKDRAEIWQAIAAMSVASVAETLRKLTLAAVPIWKDWDPWRKAPADMAAIAETLGIAVPEPYVKAKPKKAEPKAAATKKPAPKPAAKAAARRKKHQ